MICQLLGHVKLILLLKFQPHRGLIGQGSTTLFVSPYHIYWSFFLLVNFLSSPTTFFFFLGIYTVLQLININLIGVLQLAWATHCKSVFVNVRNSNIYEFTELLWLRSVVVFFVKTFFFFVITYIYLFLRSKNLRKFL